MMDTASPLVCADGTVTWGAALRPLTNEGLAEQLDAAAALVQQDSERASTLLAAIAVEASHRELSDLRAQALYLQARAELNQGHLDAALQLIDGARALWLAAGMLLSAWRTDLGRMHVLDDLGRHSEAIAVGEALVAAVEDADVGVDDAEQAAWLRAAALENLGVGHGYLGDHAAALDAYAEAEEAYRRLGMDEDVPRPLGNRGVELVEVGRFAEALEALQQAAAGFDEQDDRLFAAKCLAYQAKAHVRLGDYLASAAATQQADRYLAGQDTTTEYARTQLVRAETLTSLNLLEEALDVYDAIVPRFDAAGLRHDLADAMQGRGVVLAHLGRRDGAWESFRRAAQLYADMEAHALAASATLAQSDLAEGDEARRLVYDAFAILETSGRLPELGAALLRMAQLEDSPEAAHRHLDGVVAMLADHEIPELRWKERYERGRLLETQGDLIGARRALEASLAAIEDVRSTVGDEHERLLFMVRRENVLQRLLSLDLAEGDVAGAYARTQEARARTLVERLEGEVSVKHAPPTSAELDAIYTELLNAPSLRAASLVGEARLLERSAMRAVPSGRLPESSIRTTAEFAATSVITYETLDDEILAFVQSDDELAVVRELATTGEIRHLLNQLDAQWRRFRDPGLAARQHRHLLATTTDILQHLHIRLLASLPGVLDRDSLLIVPSQAVGNVPFAALHDGVCHLVERLAVTMAPNDAIAQHAGARLRPSLGRRLAVGVGDEATPNVDAEVAAVAALSASSTVLLDAAATVQALHEQAGRHDVVHIACHGIDRSDNPLFSAVRLGDRWLTAAEIAGFDLDGQVVVLSACSSGRQRGFGTAGELVGLPRAFLAAGAGSVVVNLWAADDASAIDLMTAFHEQLGAHEPAEALRHAQLTMLSHRPHPYHWAPAVVVGGFRGRNPS